MQPAHFYQDVSQHLQITVQHTLTCSIQHPTLNQALIGVYGAACLFFPTTRNWTLKWQEQSRILTNKDGDCKGRRRKCSSPASLDSSAKVSTGEVEWQRRGCFINTYLLLQNHRKDILGVKKFPFGILKLKQVLKVRLPCTKPFWYSWP